MTSPQSSKTHDDYVAVAVVSDESNNNNNDNDNNNSNDNINDNEDDNHLSLNRSNDSNINHVPATVPLPATPAWHTHCVATPVEQTDLDPAPDYNVLLAHDAAQRAQQLRSSRACRRRTWLIRGTAGVVVMVLLLLACAHIVELATQHSSRQHAAQRRRRRSIILMVSDGCGPASMTYARQFHQATAGGGAYDALLPLDDLLVGTSRTRSSSSWVTDSAAGATAFSCGVKTYNGAIAVDPDRAPCGTVLEAAKLSGLSTGLVVTSRITDATPASFSSHVVSRAMEADIARQQVGNGTLGRVVDVVFGGGACFFTPYSTPGSCRSDDEDLFDLAKQEHGWIISRDRAHFDTIRSDDVNAPLLGLYSGSHLAFEVDRNRSREPALHEMAGKAIQILDTLSRREDHGFFLMIEGSRIDMAAHNNDPVGHVHDILEYNRVVEVVRDYVAQNSDTVTMISISDHETGGLSVARQITPSYPEYLWKPEVIARAKYSAEYAATQILLPENRNDCLAFVEDIVLRTWFGINDAQVQEVHALCDQTDFNQLQAAIGLIISLRAQIGWATHGHSAVDVNIYSFGKNSHELAGNHENIDINKFITKELNLDLQKVTDRLRSSVDFP